MVMDGFGTLSDAGNLPGVTGPDLISAPAGADMQPGIYSSGDRRLARNVIQPDTTLTPATWPARIPVKGFAVAPEQPIAGWLLGLSVVLLVADVIASLALSGRLLGRVQRTAALVMAVLLMSPDAQAQTQESADAFALQATAELSLAHILTGNDRVDEIAAAGLTRPVRYSVLQNLG